MRVLQASFKRERGFTLLEVLVSLVILVFGLLGIIGMQAFTQVATFESYQRGQALILVQDMADRLSTNRGAAGCYAITTNTTTGSPFMGMPATVAAPTCTAAIAATTTAVHGLCPRNRSTSGWSRTIRRARSECGGG